MNTAASGLLGIFKSIGKVGWMLLITGAVEALSFLYDKFFGVTRRTQSKRKMSLGNCCKRRSTTMRSCSQTS